MVAAFPRSSPPFGSPAPMGPGIRPMVDLVISALVLTLPAYLLAAFLERTSGAAPLIALGIFAIVTFAAFAGARATYPHERLGMCNRVTLARAALASVVAAQIFTLAAPQDAYAWWVVALALLAFALDGADGWLARRSGLVSGFGARFDVEIDALLALTLALLALQWDKAGAWVLVLGLMRYAFVAAGFAWHWLERPLPPSVRRKIVCVVQIATLIILLLPPVTAPASTALALIASLLLIWSFALDLAWLARNRA